MSPDGITLPPTDPFVQVETRIASLTFLDPVDRDWLLTRAGELRNQYADRAAGSRAGLVHGDPWAGNVVATDDGPVLLDLERFSLGPPEYDLVVIAASYTYYGLLPADDYHELATAYGRDVTIWDGYPSYATSGNCGSPPTPGRSPSITPTPPSKPSTGSAASKEDEAPAPGTAGTPFPELIKRRRAAAVSLRNLEVSPEGAHRGGWGGGQPSLPRSWTSWCRGQFRQMCPVPTTILTRQPASVT
jgi:hypothetical protein